MDLLKRSLVEEIKELGRNVFTKNEETLKALTEKITDQIEKEKNEKIKAIEDDAEKLLDELDDIYDNIMDESVQVNEDTDKIKTIGETMISKAKSSKAAVDASQEIKKQFNERMKSMKKINIKFKLNKSLDENLIGRLVDENPVNKTEVVKKIKKATPKTTPTTRRIGATRARTVK